MLSLPALIGFDNVGRSRSKKDSEGTSKSESPKKEPAVKTESKKDSKD